MNNLILISIKEFRSILKIGVSKFYNMDRSGELGPLCIRFGSRRFFNRNEVMAWIRADCPHREKWQARKEKEFY